MAMIWCPTIVITGKEKWHFFVRAIFEYFEVFLHFWKTITIGFDFPKSIT